MECRPGFKRKRYPVQLGGTSIRSYPVQLGGTSIRSYPVQLGGTSIRSYPVQLGGTSSRSYPVQLRVLMQKSFFSTFFFYLPIRLKKCIDIHGKCLVYYILNNYVSKM